jgi:hypothetical protein
MIYKNYKNYDGKIVEKFVSIRAAGRALKAGAKATGKALAKGGRKLGSGLKKGATKLGSGIKTSAKFSAKKLKDLGGLIKRNPKLAALGFSAAALGVYAAANGLSPTEAVAKILKEGAQASAEILTEATKAAGTVVKSVAEEAGGVVGSVVKSGVGAAGDVGGAVFSGLFKTLASALGISVDTLKIILYCIGGLFVLGIIYKFYKMVS